MSVFETGCCGADFRSERVTFTGLWTLSVPLIYLTAPASALGPLLGRGRTRRFIDILLRANMDLIRRATLIPGLRCALAGALYPLSPRLSGFAYKHFNFTLLSLLWAVVLAVIFLLARPRG
ncbi:MAG: hypothetical protein ABIJ96_09105 [Elusimicrobiota bacterium]